MFEMTVFESAFDNKTHRKVKIKDWGHFKELLFNLSKHPGYKPKKGELKRGSSLISPAVYDVGTKRSNKNVQHWGGWAALDVDEYDGTFEEIIDRYNAYTHVCYSTASSELSHPKFRVLFPLTNDVPADKIKHFWYALNKHFGDDGDPQTKDMSRMYYVPAKYPGAYNFFFVNDEDTEIVDPNELMIKYPWTDNSKLSFYDRLPESVKNELLSRRKEQMTNTSIRWTGWKDCPFVSRRMVMEYQMLNSGWYHTLYKIMVSIAMNAVDKKYPITSKEIAVLVREIDMDNGNWYADRPLELESDRAIEYAYKNAIV